MDPTHERGRADVQLIVALIDEDAFGIEHGAHRAVEYDDGGRIDQPGQQIRARPLAGAGDGGRGRARDRGHAAAPVVSPARPTALVTGVLPSPAPSPRTA